MMKAEFEAMAGKSVTDEEYKVIEAVYTWHPAINDTTGKDQMKTLYTQFGFGVIRGMLPIAEKAGRREKRAAGSVGHNKNKRRTSYCW